jgi:hypothetical protein
MMARSTAEQVTNLHAALTRARSRTAGDAVDLTGLDDEIARLMTAAQSAPTCDHLVLRSGIEALLDEVDHLGSELQRQHDADTALRAKDAYRVGVAAR